MIVCLAPHNAVAAAQQISMSDFNQDSPGLSHRGAHAADLFFHFLGAPRGCTLRKVVASLHLGRSKMSPGLSEAPVFNPQGGTRIFQSFFLV